MKRLGDFQKVLDEKSVEPVKVAILDTGVDLPAGVPTRLKKPRYESYSWIGVPEDTSRLKHHPRDNQTDPDGHGTHMTSIVLDIARNCKVYVVQIAGNRDDIHGEEANAAVITNIARVKSQIESEVITG